MLSGESDLDVVGALFKGILDLDQEDGITFVRRFLDGSDRDVTA
jgi:hypothetical protein